MIKFSQQNAIFLQNSNIFNMFLVRVLTEEQFDKPVSYEMALKILIELIEGNVKSKKMFMNYYALIKACTLIIEKEIGQPVEAIHTILTELLRRITV
jgi:hypothetical protein